MKILTKQQILEEGWLVAYLTGDVTREEEEMIEQWLSDKEVKNEFEILQMDLEKIISTTALLPNKTIKKGLMESDEFLKVSLGDQSKSTYFNKWLIAASITFLIFSAGSLMYMFKQWKFAEEQLSQLLARNIQMADHIQFSSFTIDSLTNSIDFFVLPATKKIILMGTEKSPLAQAVVFWDQEREEIWVNAKDMEKLGEGQQYQLWALVGNAPVDAGVFDGGILTKINKRVSKADAFAVTIEKQGGSKSPTLSTLQVIGKIS